MGKIELSTKEIEKCLKNPHKYNIIVEDVVDSTNNIVKDMAEKGEKEGTIVIAKHQTAGRGRFTRKFYSPSETGVYISFLFRPDLTVDKSLFITTAAAVAVCKVISNIVGKKASIKWVNDVCLGEKKVCGILTEGKVKGNKLEYGVSGIGINIYEPEGGFPEDIKDRAIALYDNDEFVDANLLVADLIENFFDLYENCSINEVGDMYRELCSTIGKDIIVQENAKEIQGTVIGIDDDMSLIYENSDGINKVCYGEVKIKNK